MENHQKNLYPPRHHQQNLVMTHTVVMMGLILRIDKKEGNQEFTHLLVLLATLIIHHMHLILQPHRKLLYLSLLGISYGDLIIKLLLLN